GRGGTARSTCRCYRWRAATRSRRPTRITPRSSTEAADGRAGADVPAAAGGGLLRRPGPPPPAPQGRPDAVRRPPVPRLSGATARLLRQLPGSADRAGPAPHPRPPPNPPPPPPPSTP